MSNDPKREELERAALDALEAYRAKQSHLGASYHYEMMQAATALRDYLARPVWEKHAFGSATGLQWEIKNNRTGRYVRTPFETTAEDLLRLLNESEGKA